MKFGYHSPKYRAQTELTHRKIVLTLAHFTGYPPTNTTDRRVLGAGRGVKHEADTLEHIVTHRYEPPSGQVCVSAKMRRHFETKCGAFKTKLKKWEDLVTFDFLTPKRVKHMGIETDSNVSQYGQKTCRIPATKRGRRKENLRAHEVFHRLRSDDGAQHSLQQGGQPVAGMEEAPPHQAYATCHGLTEDGKCFSWMLVVVVFLSCIGHPFHAMAYL